MGAHLPHHKLPVCAVGNHVLPKSRYERVKETLEQTRQELFMRTSQETGLTKTVGMVNSREDGDAMQKQSLYKAGYGLITSVRTWRSAQNFTDEANAHNCGHMFPNNMILARA